MSVTNTVFQAVACTAASKDSPYISKDNFYLDGKINAKNSSEIVTEQSSAMTEGVFAVFDCADSEDKKLTLNLATTILENRRDRILNNGHEDVNNFILELDKKYKNNFFMREMKQYSSMAMVRIKDSKAQVFNIGNCSAFIYRSGSFNKITRDNTTADELVRVGALTPNEAKKDPRRFELTRFIGNPAEDAKTVVNYTPEFDFGGNDIFILCSDGVMEAIGERSLAYIMSKADNPKVIACSVINSAIDNGCKDDVTVIVLKPVNKKPSNRPIGKVYNQDISNNLTREEVEIAILNNNQEINEEKQLTMEEEYDDTIVTNEIEDILIKEENLTDISDEVGSISEETDYENNIEDQLDDSDTKSTLKSIIPNDFFGMTIKLWSILSGISALLGIVVGLIILNFI